MNPERDMKRMLSDMSATHLRLHTKPEPTYKEKHPFRFWKELNKQEKREVLERMGMI